MAALDRPLNRPLAILLLATAAAVVAPRAARADAVEIGLVADDAASCPAREVLVRRVANCASRPIKRWPWRRIRFEVRVLMAARTLDGRIRMRVGDRAPRQRRLIGQRSCDEILSVAALNICIAMDMVADTELASVPRRRVATTARRGARFSAVGALPRLPGPEIGLSIYGSSGVGPAPTMGLSLSALVAPQPSLPLARGVFARMDAPRSAAFHGGRIGASLVQAGLGVCGSGGRLRGCVIHYEGLKQFYAMGFKDSSREWRWHRLTSPRVSVLVARGAGLSATLWAQADISWVERDLETIRTINTQPPRDFSWQADRIVYLVGVRLHRGGITGPGESAAR